MSIAIRYLRPPPQYGRLGAFSVDPATSWLAEVGDILVDAGRTTYQCTIAGATSGTQFTTLTHVNATEVYGASTWARVTPDDWSRATYIAYLDEPVNAVWYADATATGEYSVRSAGGDVTTSSVVYVDPASMRPMQAEWRNPATVSTGLVMRTHDAVFFADSMRQPCGYHAGLSAAGLAATLQASPGTYYQTSPTILIDGVVRVANSAAMPTAGEIAGVSLTGGSANQSGQSILAEASSFAPATASAPPFVRGFGSTATWSNAGAVVPADPTDLESLPADIYSNYANSIGSMCCLTKTESVRRTAKDHSYKFTTLPTYPSAISMSPFFTVLNPGTGARTVRAYILNDGGYGANLNSQDIFMEVFYPAASGAYALWSGHATNFFLPWHEGTEHTVGNMADWTITGYYQCEEYRLEASITIASALPLYVRFTIPQGRNRLLRSNTFICPYIEVI